MPFIYSRTIHFRDTDAAGVVYFANVLAMCHEAYEASLAATGIDLKSFFGPGTLRDPHTYASLALPIVHASVDFFSPMFCGEHYEIQVKPMPLTDSKFAVSYGIFPVDRSDNRASQATTIHVCIDLSKRKRMPIPLEVKQWMERWQDETE